MRLVLGSFLTSLMILISAICSLAGEAVPGEDIAVSGTGRVEGVPFVVIAAPAEGDQIEQGQQVNVLSSSIDEQGIVKLELLVNDQIVNTIQLVPQPEVEHLAQQVWVPQAPGSYSLRIRAYNPANVVGESAPVMISVNAGAESPILPPTEEASPTPSPSPSLATLTFTPAPAQQSSSDTIAMTPTPTPSAPYLVVNPQSGLNVRRGPGTLYETVGLLQPDERVDILGQSDLGTGRWWQISFPSAPGGVGWVTASSQYSTAYNTETIAVAAAPPLPATSAPPATATPEPTAEPAPTEPPAGGSEDIVFTADRTSIAAGECTTISWKTSNVKEVYLNNLGVAGDSQIQDCPDITTIYELRVVRQDGGETTRSLTVEVQGTVPIGVIHLRPGQGVDFDRDGKVSDDGDDFRWVEKNGERRLEKWDDDEDDIILIPIGFFQSLYQIKRTDCDIAFKDLKDQDSIKASPNLSACIRTDEGRVGKIRFEDANERVEIDWILW